MLLLLLLLSKRRTSLLYICFCVVVSNGLGFVISKGVKEEEVSFSILKFDS